MLIKLNKLVNKFYKNIYAIHHFRFDLRSVDQPDDIIGSSFMISISIT